MANHLVIDGYNLIGLREGLSGDLELKREQLVKDLATYRKVKKHRITVVFDGWETGAFSESKKKLSGINIIFSRRGEKADQVICRLVSGDGARFIVVSSDREIRDKVTIEGAVSLTSEEFDGLLSMAIHSDGAMRMDDEDDSQSLTTKKKGNPRRLSKAERKKKKKLKKL